MEITGLLIIGILIGFAQAGGMGGGGIVVPILVIFFQFTPK
jgi:hypothetical protein